MATAWRWPPDIFRTRSRGRVSDLSSSNSSAERSIIACLSRIPNGQTALLHFAAEKDVLRGRQVVGERQVLVDDLDPLGARVDRACGNGRPCPPSRSSPSLGGKLPAMSLTMVDLPAPLSPMRPTTSPGRDLEVDALQRLDRAEVLGDVLQPEKAHGRHSPPVCGLSALGGLRLRFTVAHRRHSDNMESQLQRFTELQHWRRRGRSGCGRVCRPPTPSARRGTRAINSFVRNDFPRPFPQAVKMRAQACDISTLSCSDLFENYPSRECEGFTGLGSGGI